MKVALGTLRLRMPGNGAQDMLESGFSEIYCCDLQTFLCYVMPTWAMMPSYVMASGPAVRMTSGNLPVAYCDHLPDIVTLRWWLDSVCFLSLSPGSLRELPDGFPGSEPIQRWCLAASCRFSSLCSTSRFPCDFSLSLAVLQWFQILLAISGRPQQDVSFVLTHQLLQPRRSTWSSPSCSGSSWSASRRVTWKELALELTIMKAMLPVPSPRSLPVLPSPWSLPVLPSPAALSLSEQRDDIPQTSGEHVFLLPSSVL
ncbi:uncharacterized protein LOC131830202 [Mustela lutreola]|uniref:uncharacterized protein LOC131830202 n=1 Tax=Mustela lutreola TaxID=9666 RepID=UPI00279742C9|nr:uncharacterized protein LOC131830202 [Mustela lutreola]